MSNLLFGWPNRISTAVLSASSAEPALPVTNLATDQGSPAEALQIPATAGSISIDPGVAVAYRAFGIFRTNLTAAATLRVRVWPGNDPTARPVFDGIVSGMAVGFGQLVIVAPAVVVGQLCQFDVSDPTNPDGHLNIPQAFAGPCWQPERNYGYASSILRDDGTTVTKTRSGAELVRNDWQRRGFDINLGGIAPGEVLICQQLDGYARRGFNILFVPNPDSPNLQAQAVFGRLTPAAGIGYGNNSALTRTWRAAIMERL